jgi:hypothetical protein
MRGEARHTAGMNRSWRTWLLVLGVLLGGSLWPVQGWAQAPTPPAVSQGEIAKKLSIKLYCETKGLLQGPFGTILGLIMVAVGIWGLIQGGGAGTAILTIISGALITALPGLVESFLGGLGSLVRESGISNSATLRLPSAGECAAP